MKSERRTLLRKDIENKDLGAARNLSTKSWPTYIASIVVDTRMKLTMSLQLRRCQLTAEYLRLQHIQSGLDSEGINWAQEQKIDTLLIASSIR